MSTLSCPSHVLCARRRPAHVRSRFCGLALALSLGLLAAGACDPGGPASQSELAAAADPSTPRLHYDPAQEHRYSLELSSQVRYARDTTLELSLLARLRVQGLHTAHPDTTRLLLTFSDVRFAEVRASEREFESLGRELERGFVLELQDGKIRELSAAGAASPFAANILRTVASAFELPTAKLGAHGRSRLETEDAAGRHTVEFARDRSGSLTKRKLSYASSTLESPGRALTLTLVPRVVASWGELRVEHGVLASYAYEESLESALGQQGTARAQSRVSLRHEGSQARDAMSQAQLASLATPLERPSPRVTREAEGQLEDSKIADFTFEGVIAELRSELEHPQPPGVSDPGRMASDAARDERVERHNRLFLALTAMLRADPQEVARAEAMVESGERLSTLLTDALGAAGSPAASSALVRLAEDVRLDAGQRSNAVHALTRLAKPDAEAVHALVRLMADPDVTLYATYGLGTQARHLRELGQRELSAEAGQALVERLKRESSPDTRVHLLRGIANSGYAPALPVVSAFLSHPDEPLRSAAVEALRLMDDPQADSLIAARIRAEDSPFVLGAALNAAKTRAPGADLSRAVLSVASGQRDHHSRYAAIALLASWLPRDPSLREPLRQIAETDSVKALREAARASL